MHYLDKLRWAECETPAMHTEKYVAKTKQKLIAGSCTGWQ